MAVTFGVVVMRNSGKERPQDTGSEQETRRTEIAEKIYVALEGEGKVAVLDARRKKVLSTIDLTDRSEASVQYMAHNVQVAPGGESVWVTANAMEEVAMKNGHGEDTNRKDDATPSDQVIVIDPLNDKITKRISLSPENHLAHVVISPDNKKAYLTAQEKRLVYIINTANFAVEKTNNLEAQSGTHGLRITPDGAQVFIALLDGRLSQCLIQRQMKLRSTHSRVAVQTAVTPDDRFAFVSLYTTKQIARLERASGKIEKIGLPKEAKGPVQLYPTPDSRFVYVADQGYYFNQPTGDKVYRISVENGTVDQTISAGSAPHGVVVDSAGKFVYITNLLSDDVSIIDVATGKEIARIPVGDMPNGISIWHRANGGTP